MIKFNFLIYKWKLLSKILIMPQFMTFTTALESEIFDSKRNLKKKIFHLQNSQLTKQLINCKSIGAYS
jgi:hypothetical protein